MAVLTPRSGLKLKAFDCCIQLFDRECPLITDKHTEILSCIPCKQLGWKHRIVHHKTKVDNEHAKSSCAPPNRYKATLCTTKVYFGTELHCEPWFACLLSTIEICLCLCTICVCLLSSYLEKVPENTIHCNEEVARRHRMSCWVKILHVLSSSLYSFSCSVIFDYSIFVHHDNCSMSLRIKDQWTNMCEVAFLSLWGKHSLRWLSLNVTANLRLLK